MQYYYTSHLRNLQDEAYIEKQKITAQLHQSEILKIQEDLSATRRSQGFSTKRSRMEENRETAAFLQRSRLQSQLSAVRAKAECSMNRSRLQSAFQIRRQNQKAYEQLSQLDLKHQMMTRRAAREQQAAHHSFLQSKEEVEARLRQEDRLLQLRRQEQGRAEELERVYRNAILDRASYLPYW